MIRQLALIAVLALAQSSPVPSNVPPNPEHKHAAESNAPHESTILNNPTQQGAASVELQGDPDVTNSKAAKDSQDANQSTQQPSEPIPEGNLGMDYLAIAGKAAAIVSACIAAYLLIPKRKAAKATVESAKITKQEFLANGPSIQVSIGVVDAMNPNGFRIIATWTNTGGRKAILTSASLEWEVASGDNPPATPSGPLTKIQERELGAPPDEYQYPTNRIPVSNRYAICGKEHHILYGLAQLTYVDKATNTSDSRQVKFTLTGRNLTQNMSHPPRDADGVVSIFDIRLVDW